MRVSTELAAFVPSLAVITAPTATEDWKVQIAKILVAGLVSIMGRVVTMYVHKRTQRRRIKRAAKGLAQIRATRSPDESQT